MIMRSVTAGCCMNKRGGRMEIVSIESMNSNAAHLLSTMSEELIHKECLFVELT